MIIGLTLIVLLVMAINEFLGRPPTPSSCSRDEPRPSPETPEATEPEG